jgi:cobyrinic acid a,c-diamide synthase
MRRGFIAPPRVVIAGLAGDSGKTLASVGIIRALCRRGIQIAPYKKGPDYIDPAWLGAAAGRPGKNLDTYLMSEVALRASLGSAADADVAVIEGNRGLFDGMDAQGTHSTAELARRIQAPVILVIDVSKSTRTVAALVLGCLALDPALPLAGVILNRVGTRRQEQLIRDALAFATSVPVLGAIPRLTSRPLPSRHLGLLLPEEPRDDRRDRDRVLDALADAVDGGVDLDAILQIAHAAPPLPCPPQRRPSKAARMSASGLTVGYLKDEAFCFYYAENLAALETAGATLVPVSPLHDQRLPRIDALYAGGGYPEEHAAALSTNAGFRSSLANAIAAGLPVWAECGGLMYLASTLTVKGIAYPMVGALPIAVEQTLRPQGHGYVAGTVDLDNPFLPVGTQLRGHEFHYSMLVKSGAHPTTALDLARGTGVGNRRDGIVHGRVFASYMHVFAPGTPAWAPALLRLAHEARLQVSSNPIARGDDCGIHISSRTAN